MNNKINLVTGGTGFLGSHLTKYLLDAGEQVISLDNNFTGTKKNIKEFLSHPNFEFIRHDVTQPIYLEVERIWHLACPASPIHYQRNPIKTTKTSFLGTLNMLGIAKRVGAKILLASTSEVYGDPKEHPQKESYNGSVNPIGIRSCYDEGKRVAETLCFDYKRIHEIDVRVMRIFNTYGPKMNLNDGRVVSNFIVQALSGKPITIYGDGKQTRSFCYVDDLVDAIILTMSKEKGFNGPINLGNENEFTIFELAELVVEITKSKSKIIFEDLPSDDPNRRCPDTTLAKRELNWSPKVSLKDGLIKTINYFDNIIQ